MTVRPGQANRPVFVVALLALLIVLGGAGCVGGRYLWAQHHFQSAQGAADRREFTKALEHLAVCRRVWPDSGAVHFLAARTARRGSDFDLAQEYLGNCQRLGYEPKAVELEWALLAGQRGHFAEQEPFLWALVEQGHADRTLILEVLIDGYLQHFNLLRAYRCLDLYLEQEPDSFQAWLGRGHVCERLFSWADAVKSYQRAVDLRPEDHQARLRLAKALVILGPPDRAAAEFEHLGRPDDPEVLLGLARCRRQQGRLEEAVRLLEELTSRYPGDGAVLLERGRLALEASDLAGAERWLRQAVTRSPYDRDARYTLYQCLKRQGKAQEAQESLSIFERLDADLKAIDRLMRQVQKTPYNPELYHEAGVLCLRNGSEAEGVRWLRLALHYDPGHRPSHQALADYYQRTGKPDLAVEHRRSGEQQARRWSP
jgi:tetratricopeptide (TPR) repeat protein